MSVPTIPPAIRRAAYEAERTAWQTDLARLQARLEASRHIAAALGHDTTAHQAGILKDMETSATGIAKIQELIAALEEEHT